MSRTIAKLLSLPPAAARGFAEREERAEPEWFACSDPPEGRLGSGGGTAHLLLRARGQTAPGATFTTWLGQSRKLMLHAGGLSRRLPAYAACGKVLAPMPVWRWSIGQRLDQSLLDLQTEFPERLLDSAPDSLRAAVASGDVLLRTGESLPEIPDADVVCIGLWVSPEQASRHGVFFCPRNRPHDLAFCLQKPDPETIRRHVGEHFFLIDSGLWLFSERALRVLLAKCGVRDPDADPDAGVPLSYDLYGDFGPALGSDPARHDPDVAALTAAVVPLHDGEFYHIGSSRELVQSCLRLQNLVLDQRQFGPIVAKPHPSVFTQNSLIGCRLDTRNENLWIENSVIPGDWHLNRDHILTGIPRNEWGLHLPPGICLDVVPVTGGGLAIRPYGMDDAFRGGPDEAGTLWMGTPIARWFAERGLDPCAAGATPGTDLQDIPLFPVLDAGPETGNVIRWMVGVGPGGECEDAATGETLLNRPFPELTPETRHGAVPGEPARDPGDAWLRARRLSATEIGEHADLDAAAARRRELRAAVLPYLAGNRDANVFYRLDLAALANEYARENVPLPPVDRSRETMHRVYDRMFRASVLRRRGEPSWTEHESDAFRELREAMIGSVHTGSAPVVNLLEDQIAWARSPVRLDLAGGWTDTPPYCLQHGGTVVNMAVDLNGQPPIQVFVRRAAGAEIVLRSIDLGAEKRIREREDLLDCHRVGDPFSIVKAALVLAGFSPHFSGREDASLEDTLRAAGGGLEISFLAAVPKGSGLGTSSILAATVLGALNDTCGLGWDTPEIIRRTLVLEQMLTTGGGWQDQAGGLFPSVKMIRTAPGLEQDPVVHWLPEQLFGAANRRLLLYYTGITRVAKNILADIVRGMFLNESERLAVIRDIGRNGHVMADAIQRMRPDRFDEALRRSWDLNCRLDPGTDPPEVRDLMARVAPYLAAGKLLGAGGGGYLLLAARDDDAGARIRRALEAEPPNPRARFVDFSLSSTGLQITRS